MATIPSGATWHGFDIFRMPARCFRPASRLANSTQSCCPREALLSSGRLCRKSGALCFLAQGKQDFRMTWLQIGRAKSDTAQTGKTQTGKTEVATGRIGKALAAMAISGAVLAAV